MADVNKDIIIKMEPAIKAMQAYHRHEVIGIDHIPKEGGALIVCNHSLATYDMTLLMAAIFFERGRIARSLVDRLFFKIPLLGDFMEATGAVEGNQENAHKMLNEGHLVNVAPGGMRESLRPSSQRYQLRWDTRKGFVKLAMDTGVPIILAACPKADDIYSVYPSRITKFMYKKFRVPAFLARGFGPTPLPKPVKLTHFLSEPIQPPKPSADEKTYKRQVNAFHKKLVKRMEELMFEGIKKRD